MNNLTLKILGAAVSAACLSLTISTTYAAALVNFSNGAVADADDVNHNFNELATRIDNVSTTPGEIGPAGPQGAPGVDGTDGAGVSTYSWQGYGSSAWSAKAFIRKDSGNNFDKEVRTFIRTPSSATTGTTVMTRVRSDSTNTRPDRYQKLTFSYDTQDALLFTGIDNYSSDGLTLVSEMTISPGVNLRNNTMNLGMTWASAAQTDTTFVNGDPATQSFTVDSRSLLAVESITVQSVTYNNCYKILTNRSGATMGNHFQRISWFCPNNVGLVKYIQTKDIGSTVDYQVLEFDPNDSESVAVQ